MNSKNLKPFTKGDARINKAGRPIGSSKKMIAIHTIFELMDKHQERFKNELDKLAEQKIIEFYERFVRPLQPRNYDFKIDLNANHTDIDKDTQILNLRNALMNEYTPKFDQETAEVNINCIQNNLSLEDVLSQTSR